MRPFVELFGIAFVAAMLSNTFGADANLGTSRSRSGTVPQQAELVASPEAGWPQFRGLRRDGKSDERGLLQKWPAEGPKKLWSAQGLGGGYSSPIIVNGKLYVTGDVEEELRLHCLDAANGRQIWSVKAGASWKNPYPGARATPTYSTGRVYLMDAHGTLGVFEAETGMNVWSLNVLERFKGSNITWGLSECLLVDDRAVYVTAGGADAAVVALNKTTGEILWKSDPLFDAARNKALESPSYVSPILVKFPGRNLVIGCTGRHLYCVDSRTGAMQWTFPIPTSYSVLAMMPTLVGDAVFMTAPHGKPGVLLQLIAPNSADEKIGFEKKWETPLDTCQGGVVYHDGKLIGSYYPGRKGWAALDANTGSVLYKAEDIVKGSVLYADSRLYVLSENGWMRLLDATGDKFEVHGEFRFAPANNDAWAHPVILNKQLFLRYEQELSCFDLAHKK